MILVPDKKRTLSYDRKPRQGGTAGRCPFRGLPAYQGCRPASTENQLPKAIKHWMVFLAFRPLAENMPKGMFSGRCGPCARVLRVRNLNRRKSADAPRYSLREARVSGGN